MMPFSKGAKRGSLTLATTTRTTTFQRMSHRKLRHCRERGSAGNRRASGPRSDQAERGFVAARYQLAYCAVFHALALLRADQLVGWRRPWQVFTPIYRSLEHGTAKRLLEKNSAAKTFGSEVAEIGERFGLLQQWRHTADYHPEPLELGRVETLELIELARRAVEALTALPNETKLLLAVHLIARHR